MIESIDRLKKPLRAVTTVGLLASTILVPDANAQAEKEALMTPKKPVAGNEGEHTTRSIFVSVVSAAEGRKQVYIPIIPKGKLDTVPITGEGTPAPVTPTPEPIRTPLPEDAHYDTWPQDVTDAMKRVILPEQSIALIRSRVTPPDQPNCNRACYMQQTKEIWIIDPPLNPNPSPELFAMIYEHGHAHQQARREMEGKQTWEETTEYQDFLVTRDKVNAILRKRGDAEWTQEPYHLFTNIWTGYVVGDPSFTNKPANWNDTLINPYSPQLIDWKNYMDRWVRKSS